MKKTPRILITALQLSFLALLGGCSTQQGNETRSLYDLGMLPAAQNAALPPLAVAEINTPQWLNGRMMFFRLAYANDQQPQPYANSRWSMPPAQLFGERLKARIGQAGGAVLAASDGVVNVPVLRIDADDFTQIFNSPEQSMVRISVRASVLNGRTLIAHRNFTRELAAPTPNAAGGAKALANASDDVITDMMNWLAGLTLKK